MWIVEGSFGKKIYTLVRLSFTTSPESGSMQRNKSSSTLIISQYSGIRSDRAWYLSKANFSHFMYSFVHCSCRRLLVSSPRALEKGTIAFVSVSVHIVSPHTIVVILLNHNDFDIVPRSQTILVIAERHTGLIFILSFVNWCDDGQSCKPRKDAMTSEVNRAMLGRRSIFETILRLERKIASPAWSSWRRFYWVRCPLCFLESDIGGWVLLRMTLFKSKMKLLEVLTGDRKSLPRVWNKCTYLIADVIERTSVCLARWITRILILNRDDEDNFKFSNFQILNSKTNLKWLLPTDPTNWFAFNW